jgi:DNA-binding response OmpR family regulator
LHVLIAEDDRHTREGLAEVLRTEGYHVVTVADGHAALQQFEAQRPDFVCLDIMMPRQSGYEVCRRIRETAPDVPIIFISAKTEEVDKLAGFELGADDFIEKPFGVREVVARIRAVTRRCYGRRQQPPESFWMGDLEVLPAELRARRGDTSIELSLRDVNLLQLFFDHRGQALDRRAIFRHAWGEPYLPNSRTLDQHISQLRKRIELDARSPRIILTVHGVGYRFDDRNV